MRTTRNAIGVLLLGASLAFAANSDSGRADFERARASYERGDHAAAYAGFADLARRDLAEAQFWLARMYYFGQGVERNALLAHEWINASAARGYFPAQCYRGLRDGAGRAGLRWLKREAGAGDTMAAYFLALRYIRDGAGAGKGRSWLERAARGGDPIAQTRLGLLLMDRSGPPRDPREAEYWLRQAATRGEAPAYFALGEFYDETGDPGSAARWFLRAAESGNSLAQFRVGLMYMEGKGLPHDPVEALFWLSAAERGMRPQDDAIDQFREFIRNELIDAMTPEELARARARLAAPPPGSDGRPP